MPEKIPKKKYSHRILIIRLLATIIGIIFIGISVGIFQSIRWGTDPFTCMNTGISRAIGWKFGIWQLTMNCVVFIPSLLFYRHAIGIGTIINMSCVGLIADLIRPQAEKIINNIELKILFLIISVLLLCFGVALYVSANLGIAPYDALSYILEKFTGINFSWMRIITDVSCVIIGFCFGLKTGIQWDIVGIGTIITAFGTGPILRFFQNKITIPLLKKLGYSSVIISPQNSKVQKN